MGVVMRCLANLCICITDQGCDDVMDKDRTHDNMKYNTSANCQPTPKNSTTSMVPHHGQGNEQQVKLRGRYLLRFQKMLTSVLKTLTAVSRHPITCSSIDFRENHWESDQLILVWFDDTQANIF